MSRERVGTYFEGCPPPCSLALALMIRDGHIIHHLAEQILTIISAFDTTFPYLDRSFFFITWFGARLTN